MILVANTYWGNLPFWFRKPPANAAVASLSIRTDDFRILRGLLWKREGTTPKTAVLVMHPRVDFSHHYSVPALVDAGYAVFCGNSRYTQEAQCEHEELVLDVAAYMRLLREKLGFERVVLFGNCGGASLFAYYQREAGRAPEARTAIAPGGGPTKFAIAKMTKGDGILYVAAHRGQGHVLLRSVDPAVVDENDPFASDPALDMYAERNGFRVPPTPTKYAPEFVSRYREAQRARVKRLDAIAHALIAAKERATEESQAPAFEALPWDEKHPTLRRAAHEPMMVVHRTQANLDYVDPSLDPAAAGERPYGSLMSDRPDLMNMTALALGHLCTPRSWLSTWSALSSEADLAKSVAEIEEPTLHVHAGADREVYAGSDVAPVVSAIRAKDKTAVVLDGARHYFEPEFGAKETPDVDRLMAVVVAWIRERFPA